MNSVSGVKKKTVTSILKRLSVGELELLSKANSKKLRESIKIILSVKIILRNIQDKYSKL